MKKLVLYITVLLTVPSVNFAQWTNTNYYTSDIGNNGITKIVEKDNILFAATYQGIFKSNNMGEYWKGANNGLPEASFKDIEKYKNNLIALREPFSKAKGFYISTDNGDTWQNKVTNIEEPIELIEAKNDSLFAGTQKGIYYSIDGGINWNKSIATPAITQEYSIGDFEFVGNNIFAATKVGLLKSLDGGANWSKVPKSINCTKLFYEKGNLYISSVTRLMVTKDLGSTISTISSSVNLFPVNVLQFYINDELIIENDTIYYGVPNYFNYSNPQGLYISVDKGLTWQKKFENPLNAAGAICFCKSKNTWFQGTIFGGIYKSTDKGETWKLSSNGMVSEATVPNTYCNLLLPNPLDNKYQTKSLDDGNTWSLLSPVNKELNFYGCYFNKYFAFSAENGIQISEDGKTWNNSGNGIPFGGNANFLRSFEIENNTIYAYTKTSEVYKSVDEGKSYTLAFKEPKGNLPTKPISQTFTWAQSVFSMAIDSINSTYYISTINSGDTVWRKQTTFYEGLGNAKVSSNGGLSWNKSLGLPSEFIRTSVTRYGNQILINGYALISELTNRVFNETTGFYSTEEIKKLVFKIYNSYDFGVSFKEVNLQEIKSDNQQYGSEININNYFCAININGAYNEFAQQLYSLDKGLRWKSSEAISPKLKIRNILKYKNLYYLTSDSLGLWESSDNGVNWKKNTSINADNNVGIKELNGILFCHHAKGLYYLKDNQWNNISTQEVPSSIYQIGASSTSLFVTTFRDGIWKYPMSNILATAQETIESTITKVYPNPSNDILNIDFGQVGSYNIKLLTYTGTELQSIKTTNTDYTSLSVKGLPQGLYILKVEGEGKITYQKVIVQQ